MGFLDVLLRRKPDSSQGEQAVLIWLDGSALPDQVYAEYDLSTLEDQLIARLDATLAGELDGNEFGPEGTTLYLYGPDAELLFRVIEPVLRAYPLCTGARVHIRRGGPGAPERIVHLGTVVDRDQPDC